MSWRTASRSPSCISIKIQDPWVWVPAWLWLLVVGLWSAVWLDFVSFYLVSFSKLSAVLCIMHVCV